MRLETAAIKLKNSGDQMTPRTATLYVYDGEYGVSAASNLDYETIICTAEDMENYGCDENTTDAEYVAAVKQFMESSN